MPLVAVVMGSKSDTEAVQATLDVLTELEIDYEVNVISAHRTPEKARQYGLAARSKGIEVIIAAAGGAASAAFRTVPAPFVVIAFVPGPAREASRPTTWCTVRA